MTKRIEIANLSFEASQIKLKHAELTEKTRAIDVELSNLKSRVISSKTHKTRLSAEEFRQICNRQQVLKRKKAEVESMANPLKAKLREIAALQSIGYATLEKDIPSVDPELSIRKSVTDIRDRWMNFAEDQTRVNSMRIMAAQFSRELTEVLTLESA